MLTYQEQKDLLGRMVTAVLFNNGYVVFSDVDMTATRLYNALKNEYFYLLTDIDVTDMVCGEMFNKLRR